MAKSTISFLTFDDLAVEFHWDRNRLFDKQACEDYYLIVLSKRKAIVESVTVKRKSKWRHIPVDTAELEKLGSRKLKLSAKDIMTIAETLYTKGLISYTRTETNMLSKDINLIKGAKPKVLQIDMKDEHKDEPVINLIIVIGCIDRERVNENSSKPNVTVTILQEWYSKLNKQ
ncbi:hypothetical protein GQX74_009577 [Glossina fuscipes]|nr:hypothetical protein GQX74_009577 [Glossina fuscipes]